MKKIISVIIIILIIGLGAGIYAWKTRMMTPPLTEEQKDQQENQNISQLFPDMLGDYSININNSNKVQVTKQCNPIETKFTVEDTPAEEVCGKVFTAEYRQNGNDKVVFINAFIFSKNKDVYLKAMKESGTAEKLEDKDVRRFQDHELAWFPGSTFDALISQEGIWKEELNGGITNHPVTATGNNVVTKHFLEMYSPQS